VLWIDFLDLWIVCCLKLVEHLVPCSFDFIRAFILQLKLVDANLRMI
jgi:hypothetical protein